MNTNVFTLYYCLCHTLQAFVNRAPCNGKLHYFNVLVVPAIVLENFEWPEYKQHIRAGEYFLRIVSRYRYRSTFMGMGLSLKGPDHRPYAPSLDINQRHTQNCHSFEQTILFPEVQEALSTFPGALRGYGSQFCSNRYIWVLPLNSAAAFSNAH